MASLDSKIWSLKCLFLKSLAFRALAGFAGRVLNKLNPPFWAAELPKTKDKRQRAKDERTVSLKH